MGEIQKQEYEKAAIVRDKKQAIERISIKQKVSNINDFAREVVWYGRNKRATDYTSNNYMVEII